MLTGWCRARSFGDLGERNPFSSEVAAKRSTHFLDSSDEGNVLGGHLQLAVSQVFNENGCRAGEVGDRKNGQPDKGGGMIKTWRIADKRPNFAQGFTHKSDCRYFSPVNA